MITALNKYPRAVAGVLLAACLAFVLGIALVLSGCASTVAPDTVQAAQASFDGGEKTSGILSAVKGGFVVTAHFRDRYNALVATYGESFAPALKPDAGITLTQLLSLPPRDQWQIDAEHMVDFVRMNTCAKSGIKPPKK